MLCATARLERACVGSFHRLRSICGAQHISADRAHEHSLTCFSHHRIIR